MLLHYCNSYKGGPRGTSGVAFEISAAAAAIGGDLAPLPAAKLEPGPDADLRLAVDPLGRGSRPVAFVDEETGFHGAGAALAVQRSGLTRHLISEQAPSASGAP